MQSTIETPLRLTPHPAPTILPSSFLGLVGPRTSMDRAGADEADIQAPQSQAGEQTRVSRPHGHEGWPQDLEPSQAARSRANRHQDRRESVVESPGRPERFPRGARIHSSSEIRRLLAKAHRQRTASLDVFVAASTSPRSRFGVIVPKHGRRIVDRNLLKRRLREIGRRDVLPTLEGRGACTDVLVRARTGAYQVDFDSLSRELNEAVEKLCSRAS
jgi:ribonuclease P protein component